MLYMDVYTTMGYIKQQDINQREGICQDKADFFLLPWKIKEKHKDK